MKLFLITLVVSCLAFSGCEKLGHTYSIRFLSLQGAELANGSIVLKEMPPEEGKTRGHYALRFTKVKPTSKEIEWFFRLFEEKKEGEVEWSVGRTESREAYCFFNFMPNMADANIVANTGSIIDGASRGTWSYGINAGGFEGGVFEILKR